MTQEMSIGDAELTFRCLFSNTAVLSQKMRILYMFKTKEVYSSATAATAASVTTTSAKTILEQLYNNSFIILPVPISLL